MEGLGFEGHTMRKTIYGDILKYTFEPRQIPRVGHSVYLLKSENSLTIIDPTSEEIVGEIKQDSDFCASQLKNVIISHYHGDHFLGIAGLPECTVWGSAQYLGTLGHRYPPAIVDRVKPSLELRYGEQYMMSGLPIQFYPGSGHTACGILTIIRQEDIHTNDIIGFNVKGEPILPLVSYSAYEYYRTILRILDFHLKVLVPHMQELDQKKIGETLLIYRDYFEGILESREKFDLLQFEEKRGVSFDYSEHHSKNLRHLGI